jgi:glutathione synthase/RimK-type ligase-like ATP-grasp enzyme
MKGRGFWKINNFNDFGRALRGTRRKKAATHFMEYIDAPYEYRVHIFKGKSIRVSLKAYADPEAKGHYTTAKPSSRVWHVRKAAKQAVAALGLDFGAVDILATDDECWVLEVNAAPGLGGSTPRLYARTFLRWQRGDW